MKRIVPLLLLSTPLLDARYLLLTLRGRAEGEIIEADMNPLLLSAGVRLRF